MSNYLHIFPFSQMFVLCDQHFRVQGNLSVLDKKRKVGVMLYTHKAYLQILTIRKNMIKRDKIKQCKLETILSSILFISAGGMLTGRWFIVFKFSNSKFNIVQRCHDSRVVYLSRGRFVLDKGLPHKEKKQKNKKHVIHYIYRQTQDIST